MTSNMCRDDQAKQPAVDNFDIARGLELAGEIILLPGVIKIFPVLRCATGDGVEHKQTASLLACSASAMGDEKMAADISKSASVGNSVKRKLNQLSPAKWAAGMIPAFRIAAFAQLLNSCISRGVPAMEATDPETALMYGGNRKPPANDLRQIAYLSAHEHLLQNTHDARWLSLVFFSIGRTIAVNSNNAFSANEWDDVSFRWFTLEKAFVFADGKTFARQIVNMNKTFFRGEIPKILGERLPHGLAEMAVNAHQSTFFATL